MEIIEIINAPVNNVWKHLSDFGSISKWASLIVKSSVEGQGIGAIRTCSLKMPGTGEYNFQEVLEIVDENTKIFSYSVIDIPAVPIKGATATWKLEDAGNNQTKINYNLDYESSELSPDELQAMMGPNVNQFIKDLEKVAT